jgi:hypothetical protein
MITVDANVRRTAGVGLVTVLVENEGDRPRQVRLRATVSVMPPRRRGAPERGWDGREMTVPVPPGRHRSLGFATDDAVDPDDPPVELVDRSVADDADPGVPAAPDAVVRSLGDGRPPRDAVPVGASGTNETTDDDRDTATDETPPDGRDEPSDPTVDWEWVGEGAAVESRAGDRGETPTPDEAAPVPTSVADWLATVERRCDRVERVTDDVPLSVATTTLDEAGGLSGLVADANDLAADARRLRAVARRAERLAERAESTTLPRDALEAVA